MYPLIHLLFSLSKAPWLFLICSCLVAHVRIYIYNPSLLHLHLHLSSLADIYRDAAIIITPLLLQRSHTLHLRDVRLEQQPLVVVLFPSLPLRRSLGPVLVRVSDAPHETRPVPLHDRHHAFVVRAVARGRIAVDVLGPEDGIHFYRVGHAIAAGHQLCVLDVPVVVVDGGDAVLGVEVRQRDAWASVAQVTVRVGDLAPVGGGVREVLGEACVWVEGGNSAEVGGV